MPFYKGCGTFQPLEKVEPKSSTFGKSGAKYLVFKNQPLRKVDNIYSDS
jgi:hypothetical protein